MLDLPLVEIKRLLKLMSQPSAACDDVDRLIEGELARVRTRIRSLRALEQQLSAQHSCCTTPPQTAAECGILHELVTTAHQESGPTIGPSDEGDRVGLGPCLSWEPSRQRRLFQRRFRCPTRYSTMR